MKYVVIFGIAFVFLYLLFPNKVPSDNSIQVGNTQYSVIRADTDVLRVKGLSGKKDLPKNTVMLFVFPSPGKYGFWMKDMLFPIDILWSNENGTKVQYVERNLSPQTYPTVYYPPESSLYVIEAAAGGFDSVNVGDDLVYKK